MALFNLNLTPSKKELRLFAGLWWPALCAAVGLMLVRKFHAPAPAMGIAIVGAITGLAGLFSPALIRPLYIALMRLTFPIGWVVSHIVLTVSYFGILAPIGLVLRIFHDPMERKLDPQAKSYWYPRQASDVDRYFRQL